MSEPSERRQATEIENDRRAEWRVVGQALIALAVVVVFVVVRLLLV